MDCDFNGEDGKPCKGKATYYFDAGVPGSSAMITVAVCDKCAEFVKEMMILVTEISLEEYLAEIVMNS